MGDLLHLLHQEHTNIGKLLTICERLVEDPATADPRKLEIVCEILEYMQAYPDVWHHPLEDAILRKLEKRDAAASEQMRDLEKHHEWLAELTADLLDTTRRILADEMVSRDAFRQSGMLFVEKYRDHIRLEEETFFPAARKALTELDWEEIENDFSDPGDPLFASEESDRFMRLRFEIFQNDGGYS